MSLLEVIDQVPEISRLIALELKRNLQPHEDTISTREAYERYGRGWIERYTQTKDLHPQFHGSKKMYSISEIERVKAKENVAARLQIKQG